MFLKTPEEGYHYNKVGIKAKEKEYECTYLGYWSLKENGIWTSIPYDIFYDEVPDRSKGHTNYIAFCKQDGEEIVKNGVTAFSVPIIGVLCNDGEILVSRYRDHRDSKGDKYIEGGRDIIRHGGVNNKLVEIFAHKAEFNFRELIQK